VRQNLALVLGLQGKFDEAEVVFKRDMSPADATANLAYLKQSVSQPNSWAAIKSQDGKPKAQAQSRAVKNAAASNAAPASPSREAESAKRVSEAKDPR